MRKIGVLLIVIILTSIFILAVPYSMIYQGTLQRSGDSVNETLQMSFKIYKDLTSSDPADLLWSESDISVEVREGVYSVELGSVSNPISPELFTEDVAYIELVVDGDTLSPRSRINSAGYSLQAGGLSNSGSIFINTNGIARMVVLDNGNVGIASSNPQVKLAVDGVVDAASYRGDGSSLSNMKSYYTFHIYGEMGSGTDIADKFLVVKAGQVTKITAYTKSTTGTFSLDVEKGNYDFSSTEKVGTLTFTNEKEKEVTTIDSANISSGDYLRLNATDYTSGEDVVVIVEVSS